MGLFGLGKKKEDSANNELNPIKNSINIENKDMPDFSNPFNQESKETTTSPPTPNNNPFNQEPEQMPPIPKAPKNLSNNSEKTDFANKIKNPFNNEPNQIPPTTHSTPNNNPFMQQYLNKNQSFDFTEEANNLPKKQELKPLEANNSESLEIPKPSRKDKRKVVDNPNLKKTELIKSTSINIPTPDYNKQKTNEDREYLDEILDKDTNIETREIENVAKMVQEANKSKPEINTQSTNYEKKIIIENEEDQEIEENFKSKDQDLEDEKLPEFDDEEKKLERKTKEIMEKFKQKKVITGDLFINAEIYKNVLSTNLELKEIAKDSISQSEKITNTFNTQQKSEDQLKQEIEDITNKFMMIEEKLFENNPYLR